MEKTDDGVLCNGVEVHFVKHEDLITRYDENKLFGPVLKGMEDKWPADHIQRHQLENVLLKFK